MLRKVMPKAITTQAYLVTTLVVTVLLAVIGYMYADTTRERIFLSQERKLIEIISNLDQLLTSDELMDKYEAAGAGNDEAAVRELRASLQPMVEAVGRQYSGFAMGYSLQDSRLAVYPYRPEFFAAPMSIQVDEIYSGKKAILLVTNFESVYWNEPALAMNYPVLANGKRIGLIWANVPMATVEGAVHQAWLQVFLILLVAWLVLMAILNKVFHYLRQTLVEEVDKIARLDDTIDTTKIPALVPALGAVTALRNSLRDKEAAFRTLAENSPDMISRHDIQGERGYENPAFKEGLASVQSCVIGNTVLSASELAWYHRELVRNVAANGIAIEVECERHTSSGIINYLKVSIVPERDETGRVISVLTVARDFTDIKEGNELFQTVFNLSPKLMTVTRQRDDALVLVNDTFLQATGLESFAVIGRSTAELDLWHDRNRFEKARQQLQEKGCLDNYEAQFSFQGRVVTGLMSSRAITVSGEPCWLHSITDITEKKRLDAEMARLDSLNLVGEMAASIGHEVRNPMTTVRGYLQLFQRKAEFIPYNDRLVTMIEEIDRANAIITEFLSLAKNKVSELTPGNLNTVVESLTPLMQADALRMGQQLEVHCSPVPDTLLDGSEIRQIILNLFRNAMDAMALFGVATIRTYADNEGAVLEISDTGGGIPPEVMEKLYTPFVTTKESGTGLGLAVCYRVAQRHGATIHVDTSPAGTTFSIRFQPLKAA